MKEAGWTEAQRIVLGYFVQICPTEEGLPIEDIEAIFRSVIVDIFSRDKLVVRSLLYQFLHNDVHPPGVALFDLPARHGELDKVTLSLAHAVELSRPVTMYASIVAVSKLDVVEHIEHEDDAEDAATALSRYEFSDIFESETKLWGVEENDDK